jgi:3-deoxy-7-phosphoheptulonate synthase
MSKPYTLVSPKRNSSRTKIKIKNLQIGGTQFVVMAGPCTIESKKQVHTLAGIVKDAGATVLRGGAFKPRTSPYSFQGMGEDGLFHLKDAGRAHGLVTISELMDARHISAFLEHVDIIQVGARNMQNFELLKALGKIRKPVLLKRGFANTVEELLCSAEYILAGGNTEVILCERGIKTFETGTRCTLDISAIPIIKNKTHLPVIVDPSHAAGQRDIVPALARAALAVGADGILVEVHHRPKKALCDGEQALLPTQFRGLIKDLKAMAKVMGRKV